MINNPPLPSSSSTCKSSRSKIHSIPTPPSPPQPERQNPHRLVKFGHPVHIYEESTLFSFFKLRSQNSLPL